MPLIFAVFLNGALPLWKLCQPLILGFPAEIPTLLQGRTCPRLQDFCSFLCRLCCFTCFKIRHWNDELNLWEEKRVWIYGLLASAEQIQRAQMLPKDQECERILSVDRMKKLLCNVVWCILATFQAKVRQKGPTCCEVSLHEGLTLWQRGVKEPSV